MTSKARWNDGQFQLRLQSEVGRVIEVQSSTNLTTWTNLLTLTNATGEIPFMDAETNQRRFYRMRQRP